MVIWVCDVRRSLTLALSRVLERGQEKDLTLTLSRVLERGRQPKI
jgi:hypothetical protein